MRRGSIVFVVAAFYGAACLVQSSIAAERLEGAWRVVSMRLITVEQDTIQVPAHESLVIFCDGYYSMGYAFGSERASTYAERWHPNEREKIDRFSSLIVNSGSYKVSGNRIDADPLFALAPAFVGGKGEFTFEIAGDKLLLTWVKSVAFDGLEYPSRGTVTLLELARME